jgi:hypothetical protein
METVSMEPRTHSETLETCCKSCGAALTSQTHLHRCLRDRVDALRYAELFWEEA